MFGSLERFIGILIEHYEGKFPTWLAPVQAVLLNITEKQSDYVRTVERELKGYNIRVTKDLRNEKVGFKIREHTLQGIPFLLVVGDREVEAGLIAVRSQTGEDLGVMTPEAFSSSCRVSIQSLTRSNSLDEKRLFVVEECICHDRLDGLWSCKPCSDPLQNLANTEASDLTMQSLIRKRAIKVMASSQPSMV